jgi:hypothetical protein
MPAVRGVASMIAKEPSNVQVNAVQADVLRAAMSNQDVMTVASASEGRRTLVALASASIISLVVWGLVVVLNVH